MNKNLYCLCPVTGWFTEHTELQSQRLVLIVCRSVIEPLCFPQIGWPFQIPVSSRRSDALLRKPRRFWKRTRVVLLFYSRRVCARCLYTRPSSVQSEPHLHIVCMQLHESARWVALYDCVECDSLRLKDNLWVRAPWFSHTEAILSPLRRVAFFIRAL